MNRSHSTLAGILLVTATATVGCSANPDVTSATLDVIPSEVDVAAIPSRAGAPDASAGFDASVGPDASLAPPPARAGTKAPTNTPLTAAGVKTGLSTKFSWAQGQQSVVMMAQSTGWCFLTAVSGHFVGFGEAVYIAASNGYWILGGISGQQGLRGEATCVAWSTLNPNGGEDYLWDAYAAAQPIIPNCWLNGTCPHTVQSLWLTDSFCSLMGIGGALDGKGEFAYTLPVANLWTLQVSSQQLNGTEGWAGCFHHHNLMTTFSSQYVWQQGQAAVDIGDDQNRVCGLTFVTGKFMGGGESVSIEDVGGRWMLSGTSQQVGVTAAARCASIAILVPGP